MCYHWDVHPIKSVMHTFGWCMENSLTVICISCLGKSWENTLCLIMWNPVYITSRLDYCNSLYFGASQKELARLQLVQNAAARLLTGTRKFEHITPVLRSRHWLPVHFRIRFKILVFTFKSLNGLAPPYLSDLVNPYTPARCLRSANQMRLQGPKAKKDPRGKQAFSAAAPTLWNELPMPVKQAPSLSAFKARLKTHFFLLAFGE